ncbi:putative RNA-dependent RNA polymerase 5 [Capsicum annuum]
MSNFVDTVDLDHMIAEKEGVYLGIGNRAVCSSTAALLRELFLLIESHRPNKAYLSKNLISLLAYGGVQKEFFMEILESALEETKQVYLKKRGALKDNGQVSGRVLVYRNPGLHFGDVHAMKARYVEELVDIVGDAKYGIFCFTKGPRSAATEIANGDFDGDISSRFSELLSGRKGAYLLLNPTLSGIQKWVSFYGLGDHELVDSYTSSKPWTRMHSTPKAVSKKPSEFSVDELEYELFRQFLEAKAEGTDSWLAFMDRLLMLRGDEVDGMHSLKGKMLHLIDIYYDALDAPKSGKKVSIPRDLKANKFPHYMEKGNPFSYHSTSILDQIYDHVDSYPDEDLCVTEIYKLPCFEVESPPTCMELWRGRYEEYKKDMTRAMNSGSEHRITSCNEVIKKYKKLLYGAVEFEQTVRKSEDIFNEALAIYHVTYDHARTTYNIEKCGFAWKVAGSALCRIHVIYSKEKELYPFCHLFCRKYCRHIITL